MPRITENKQYNIALDIYRILFTTLIMLHHFRSYSDVMPYGGGYMATDFFFMLSGYLMYLSIKGYDKKSVADYLVKRYKRLVIPLIVCNLVLLSVSYVFAGYRLSNGLVGFVKENLMIELFTCSISDRFNPPMWYLGTLFIATIISYLILSFSKVLNLASITRVLMGLIVGSYIFLVCMNGNGNIYTESAAVFAWRSMLRGISGMSVGIIVASLPVKVKTSRTRWVIFAVFMIVYLYFMAWRDGYSRIDILIYILIALGIVTCKNLPEIVNTKIMEVVLLGGRSSYYAFIIHYPIIRLIEYYRVFDGMDWKLYSMFFILLIWILALMCHEIAITISKLTRRVFNV